MADRKWKKKCSWHMIVKNEEKVLDRCLTSMKGCWDPGCLVIVDTGSTDKTIEIAKSHGAIVEHFQWCQDFGKARQYALNKLYEHCPDTEVVGWCDADDILMSPDDVVKYREFVDNSFENSDCWAANFCYIYSHEHDTVGNQGIANFKYHRLRCFRKGTGEWRGRIHEFIHCDATKQVVSNDVTFHHFRDEALGTLNTKRNLEILRLVVNEATPEEKPRTMFYYGKECTYNGLWQEAIDAFKTYLPISNFPDEKARSLYELANCYKQLGNLPEAKKWAFEAIAFDQRYADPYLLLAQLAYDAKDWAMVIAWASIIPQLGKPTTLFFDFIPATTYLPFDYMQASYFYLGNNIQARQCLKQCMSYKPHDRRYLNNWSIFHQDIEKIAIIIPTLNRKERLLNCIQKIRENAYVKNYEILIGFDGNEQYFNEVSELLKDQADITTILFEEKSTVPVIVERLVDVAKKMNCKFVTYLGDDTEPAEGFLIHAYEASEGKYLVAYNDRVWKGEIACHWFSPIDLRDELGGFFFYKGYNHVGCDNELTNKAKKIDKYKYAENAIVNHIHYIQNICSDKTRVAEYDSCYQLAWGDDEKVQKDRKLLFVRMNNNYIADTETIKVNIGAGSTNYPGYIKLDKYVQDAEIKKDILEPGLFNPCTVDKFLAEHVLEHFSSADGEKFIKTCYDALKPGGEIELAVPDIGRIGEVKDQDYAIKVLYGWREFGNGMFHLFGYTDISLMGLLEKNGFKITSINRNFEYDAPALRILAVKN